MNKKVILSLILFGFVFNSVIAFPSSAILRFGFFAEDGTLIQPYIEVEGKIGDNKTIVPVFIPQYLKTLEYDEFILYCEFPDENNHTLELVIQNSIVVTVTEQDNYSITGYRQYNETIWVDSDSMDLVIRNNRGYGKYRYIELVIDETVFPAFDQSNVTEKFVIRYQNLSIQFFHKTNPYFFDVTQNLGEFQLTLIFSALLTGIFALVCIRIAKKLQERTKGIWFPIRFSTVFLVATWGMGLTALFLFFAATSGSDIQWQIAILPVPVLNFIVAAVVGLWTPSEFQKKLEEHYILEWDLSAKPLDAIINLLKNTSSKIQDDVSNLVMKKYYVYREGKKVYYFNKKNSIKEVFQAIIWGPRAIKDIEKTFTIKANDKNQKTMFVKEIKVEKEKASWILKRLEASLFVLFVVLFIATMLSTNEVLSGVLGFFTGVSLVFAIIITSNHSYFVKRKISNIKKFFVSKTQVIQWVSLASSVKEKKEDLPIDDRGFLLKLIVPIIIGSIFFIGAVLSATAETSSVFGLISILFLSFAFLTYLYEYFKLRDEITIVPLSRNVINAVSDASFVVELEKGLVSVVSDYDDIRRRFIVHQQLSETRDILEAEKRFYPRNFQEKFGKEKLTEVKELISKNKKGEELVDLTDDSNKGSSATKGGGVK